MESTRFPFVPVSVTIEGRTLRVEAYADTGFEGDLSLPPELVPTEAFPVARQAWRVANNAVTEAFVFPGIVGIDGFDPVPARIAALGVQVIVGRGVTDRYRVTFERGERAIVEP